MALRDIIQGQRLLQTFSILNNLFLEKKKKKNWPLFLSTSVMGNVQRL